MGLQATEQDPIPLGRLRHGKLNPPKDSKPSFAGRTVLLTGGNTGIGFEAAVKFVELGASRLILGVRTVSKGEDARVLIEQRAGRTGIVEVWPLDMLEYTSIQTFATRARTDLERLDIAVLNAGVVAGTFQRSKYGYEQTIQVNTLSTVLLALLLLPTLKASSTPEFTPVLEIVSSSAHQLIKSLASDGDAGVLDIYSRPEVFDGQTNYNVSKLLLEHAHIHLTRLATSPTTGQAEVIVVSVCPGGTRSELARDVGGWLLQRALWIFARVFQRTTEEGSRVYISGTSLGFKGHGKFWYNDEIIDAAPVIHGVDNKVWDEIIKALDKDVSDIHSLVNS